MENSSNDLDPCLTLHGQTPVKRTLYNEPDLQERMAAWSGFSILFPCNYMWVYCYSMRQILYWKPSALAF